MVTRNKIRPKSETSNQPYDHALPGIIVVADQPKKVIAEIRKFRDKNTLKGLAIKDMITEGRY